MTKLPWTGMALLLGCSGAGAVVPAPAESARVVATSAPSCAPPVLAGTPDIASLVARARPSVVNITVEEFIKLPRFELDTPFDFFPWGVFPQWPRRGGERGETFRRQAQGSGFIIDDKGHVVTNAHVVDGASVVRVRLFDDREFKASVKGRDFEPGDVLLEVDRTAVGSVAEVERLVKGKAGPFLLKVRRHDATRFVVLEPR